MNIFLLSLLLVAPNLLSVGIKDLLDDQTVKKHIAHIYDTEPPEDEFRYQLAATLIFQDEAPYLKEWIEYHLIVGVEHFYLYNNLSKDNYKKVLKPYIKKGIVDLIEWDLESDGVYHWNGVQQLAYRHAINQAKADAVKWLAIIDADEFMVPRNQDSVLTFLKNYENDTLGGVRVGWLVFGTSHVDKIPSDKTLIETLLWNEGYKRCGEKSIVRPFRVDTYALGSPHAQPYKPGYRAEYISLNLFQLNHYWARDEDYLHNIKIPRRIIWGTPPETTLHWAENLNRETKGSQPIQRFVPELRKRMGLQ